MFKEFRSLLVNAVLDVQYKMGIPPWRRVYGFRSEKGAVVELQAGQVMHLIPLRGWPTIEVLGIYPTLQSLALQGLFDEAIELIEEEVAHVPM